MFNYPRTIREATDAERTARKGLTYRKMHPTLIASNDRNVGLYRDISGIGSGIRNAFLATVLVGVLGLLGYSEYKQHEYSKLPTATVVVEQGDTLNKYATDAGFGSGFAEWLNKQAYIETIRKKNPDDVFGDLIKPGIELKVPDTGKR